MKLKKRKNFFSKVFFSKPSLHLVAWIARFFVTLLLKTVRLKIEGRKEFEALIAALNADQTTATPVIIALWHEKLLLAPLLRKCAPVQSCTAVVSGSRDGKLLATFIKTYKETDVIVATPKNRAHVLKEMIATLHKRKVLIITPDGPRGPRHTVKMGIIYSSMKSSATIVPIHWHASHAWQLPTWDKLCIPYPFSKVTFIIRPPIPYKENKTAQELAKLLATSL